MPVQSFLAAMLRVLTSRGARKALPDCLQLETVGTRASTQRGGSVGVSQRVVRGSMLSTAHQSVSNWRQSPVGQIWPEPIRGRNIPKNPRIVGIQDPTIAGITGSGVFFGNTAYQPAGTCLMGMPRNRSRIRYGAFCKLGWLLSCPPGGRLVTHPGRSGSIYIAPCPICPLMPPQIPRLRSPGRRLGYPFSHVSPVRDSCGHGYFLVTAHFLEADTRGREIWEGADVSDDPTGLFQSLASSRDNRPEDDASPSGMILLPAPFKGAVGSSGGSASGLVQGDPSYGRPRSSSERAGISDPMSGPNAASACKIRHDRLDCPQRAISHETDPIRWSLGRNGRGFTSLEADELTVILTRASLYMSRRSGRMLQWRDTLGTGRTAWPSVRRQMLLPGDLACQGHADAGGFSQPAEG